MNTEEEKQLRKRFISDKNLPIQVIQNPFFEERLDLFERKFEARTKYDKLLNRINRKYDGNASKFLEAYNSIRDKIVTECSTSQAFQDFNAEDMSKYALPSDIVGNVNLYTQQNTDEDDNFYVSFDLKKANFQALKFANPDIVFNADTYIDFIEHFTKSEYVKTSKYTRQVIFGKMNPKRTMTVEKFLIYKVYQLIADAIKVWGKPFSMNSDEIIYKLNKKLFDDLDITTISNLEKIIKETLNLDVRVIKFRLHYHKFNLATSKATLNVFEKDCFYPMSADYMCVPTIYAPQVYKMLTKQKINDDDLVFYHEHELVRFLNPLILDMENEAKIDAKRYDDLPF